MAAPSVVNEERISSIPKYVNGVLETTFCSQITFGVVGRGQKWLIFLAMSVVMLLHVVFQQCC